MPKFSGAVGEVHHDVWLPAGEVGSVVVFAHGFGEHVGLHAVLADRFAAAGVAFLAFDAMGHGRSEGERGVIDFDAYAADTDALVRIARDRFPGRHLTLVGHSAGAAACYLLSLRRPGVCDALVLSGAPLLPLDWVTDQLEGSTAADPEPLDPTTMLSTHPVYVEALLTDPLVFDGDFPDAMLRSMRDLWDAARLGLEAGRPDVPVLLVHGGADPVVPREVAEEVASLLPAARLHLVAGDLHDVLNEHDRDEVHRVVVQFVLDRAHDAGGSTTG